MKIAPFLMAKVFSIGHEELKVACVGLIDVWIIDLIDNAVTDGEPKTTARMVGRSDAFLGAGSPAWLDSGRTKRNGVVMRGHG
jgi:hypothetical protein